MSLPREGGYTEDLVIGCQALSTQLSQHTPPGQELERLSRRGLAGLPEGVASCRRRASGAGMAMRRQSWTTPRRTMRRRLQRGSWTPSDPWQT